jgi:uncharacterized protein YceH (UPF0502 family)
MRGRSDRLHSFDSVADAESKLAEMASHPEPLVKRLPRRPGQKEERWAHLAGGAVIDDPVAAETEHASEAREPLSARVQRLEEQVASLTAELRALKEKLGE